MINLSLSLAWISGNGPSIQGTACEDIELENDGPSRNCSVSFQGFTCHILTLPRPSHCVSERTQDQQST